MSDGGHVNNDGGGPSVTNDAERVVAEVTAEHPSKRIVYRDTMGHWDELMHCHGIFAAFASWNGYVPTS